jgi:hypothetical protein
VGKTCIVPASDWYSPLALVTLFASSVVGVGNHEKPCPLMGSTDVGCSYNAPPCNHPHFGKVTENSVESERNVACDVLQEDDSGS